MLAPGFADPARDSQRVFRLLLDALARPGQIQALPVPSPEAPPPLGPATFALVLMLADYETPIWLDPALRCDAVVESLRFHCGAPLTAIPQEATFAVVARSDGAPDLDAFATGTPDYPDRSTTVLFQVQDLTNEASGMVLSGPGIAGTTRLGVDGLPSRFVEQWAQNHTLYPQGVDAVFVTSDRLAALPRSVRVEQF